MKISPRRIEIMDTTLRDGEQTHNVSFAPGEKLQLARILLGIVNVDRIEVANARVSAGEKESLTRITDWALREGGESMLGRVEVLGLVDGGKSLHWIHESGGRVINLLTKGSLKHLAGQLKKTPQEHFRDIEAELKISDTLGISVNVYLEDWSNGYRDSREYVYQMIDFLSGTKVNRIMLPDTLGVLYPSRVAEAFEDLSQKYPKFHFDFHPHNDYGLGTINSLEAARSGAKGLHVTVNTLGERTGNASVAEVIAGIHDHLHFQTGVKEDSLYMVSRMVETFSGKRLAANAPIVGEDVFTQTAGIHADGDKKGNLYHNPLTPSRFGRKRSYSLGKLAGKASLEKNLHDLGIELSEENLKKVLTRIVELGDNKKTVTVDDLPFIISDVLKTPVNQNITIDQAVITSGKGFSPVCSLVLTFNEKEYSVQGSGDGGYDAFFQALQKFAKEASLSLPRLVDYEVRIPPGGRTSAIVECTITWEISGEKILSTRGVDPDQTIAAVRATEIMLNRLLEN